LRHASAASSRTRTTTATTSGIDIADAGQDGNKAQKANDGDTTYTF
jgi:hypothetical protein